MRVWSEDVATFLCSEKGGAEGRRSGKGGLDGISLKVEGAGFRPVGYSCGLVVARWFGDLRPRFCRVRQDFSVTLRGERASSESRV